MEQRRVGKSGLKVSLVGFGCNIFGSRVDAGQAERLVHEAIDLGITLFDTADSYGGLDGLSEKILGATLADGRRDKVVIASKAGLSTVHEDRRRIGASRRYLMQAVDASLRRLKTDRIDLYQIHTPDPETPIEETLRALEDMTRAGKILHCGASNLAAWQCVDAAWQADRGGMTGYVSVQNEYSLLAREGETELLSALDAAGQGLLPYFPLASGLLTGKYSGADKPDAASRLLNMPGLAARFLTPERLAAVDRLSAFAAERERSLVELAFSWIASRPQVSSILASATSSAQLRQNAAAADWRMSAEDVLLAGELAATDRS